MSKRRYTSPVVARGLTQRTVVIDYLTEQGAVAACKVTVPAGTKAALVQNGTGRNWAVADIPWLKRATGNDHDPDYRYAWLPAEAMEPEATSC